MQVALLWRWWVVSVVVLLCLMPAASAEGKAVVPDSVDRLISQLQDSHWLAANEAMQELVAMGRRVVPRLIPLLEHDNAAVRHRVVEVLGRMQWQAEAAVPELQRRLTDDAMHVSAAAARALAAIDNTFPSARGVQLTNATDHPWLEDKPLNEVLFFEALHGSWKLLGFGSHAHAVDYSSDHIAFFLLVQDEERSFRILDISDDIDRRRVYHRTRNLELPHRDHPAILMTTDHFAPDILPGHYVIDERGVSLQVEGEWVSWDEARVRLVAPSERLQRIVPWNMDESLPPLWSGSQPWLQEDQFLAAPYVRKEYSYQSDEEGFVQTVFEPLTFYAVAAAMVEALQQNESPWTWENYFTEELAAQLRAEAQSEQWAILEMLASTDVEFLGYSSDRTARLQTARGAEVDVVFDRTYREAYWSLRVSKDEAPQSDPSVAAARIADIRLVE